MIRKRYDALKKMRKINEVGISRIHRYVAEHHPHALKNFNRNLSIIKDYIVGGGEYVCKMYGLSATSGSHALKCFYEYALKAEEEDANG